MSEEGSREFDVVLWGATGFTGQLVAEYLLRTYGAEGDLRWALGGRNQAKLERVRKEIGEEVGSDSGALPLVVGDAGDAAFTRELAGRSTVVCTTVGPYARYGSELVAACAESGTHYCDLTGEVHWMRKMIDAHQERAEQSGARIVFTCGFDCIPSDLGVFFIQSEMQRLYGVASPRVKLGVKAFKGAASGGTIASMINMLEEATSDREVARVMANPYSLNPRGDTGGPDTRDRMAPAFDDDFDQWTAPFVMAAVNTRVVRRSNALLGHAYGERFRYDEAMLMGKGPGGAAKAAATAAAMGGGMGAMAIAPIRKFAAGKLPAPGEGPTRRQQEEGFFDLHLFAEHPTDPTKALRARVTGDRDPGYGSTSKMLGESAVCLAKDALDCSGGMWTPAAAMGRP